MHSLCVRLVQSSTVGYLQPYFPKMTSSISWLLIGGEHLRKIFGKSLESCSENGWLLKIVGRDIDDIRSKNSSKRLISLTSWASCDHIFRSHDGTSESVGKGSGHLRESSARQEKKKGGVGGGKERKKRGEGWVGKEQKKSAEGGVGG